MYFAKSGSSEAIRKFKQSAQKRLNSIESDEIVAEAHEKAKHEKQINEVWLKQLILELEEGLSGESEILLRLKNNVFSVWRKNKFLNKYTLAHVHIFRECFGVSAELAIQIETIVFNSYNQYEKETGNHVKIISRVVAGGI